MIFSRIKRWVKHFLSILLISGLLIYIWKYWPDMSANMTLSAGQVITLAFLIFATWILNSLPMLLFTRLMNKRVGFWENFSALLASTIGNYLPMRIGTLIRMRFFKKVHDVDYAAFLGLSIIRLFFLATASGFLGLIGLLGLIQEGEGPHAIVFVSFIFLAVAPILAVLVPLEIKEQKTSRLSQLSNKFTSGHSLLRENPKAALALMVITLSQSAVLGIRLYISFRIFGIDLTLWHLLVLGPTAVLVTFTNLTPGNLGLREWVIGALTGITGLELQSGIFAGTLDRSILLALTFIVGPVCMLFTLRSTNRTTDTLNN